MLKEPPLVNPKILEEATIKLSEWLYKIIDTDYNSARHRPLYGKMAAYEQEYKADIKR